ncbi:MAG TPA: chloride channel protein, partial [Rudaea sp.]|nr:chloride channel protein [Rudaea sp.]
TDQGAVILLGMAAFLTGVTQAPITSAVISLELTANQNMVIPIMAVCLLARGVSALVCHTPVYRAFAIRAINEFEKEAAASVSPPTPPAPPQIPPPVN